MLELRKDLKIIFDLIQENEKVLDVGCGNGELLDALLKIKKVDCRGIELSQGGVNKSVEKGLSVIQGDANFDLSDYPDSIFSTVILSQTIHAMLSPKDVMKDLIRIGKQAIISFPNFGYWKIRMKLLINGQMPRSNVLPYSWYNTPNIHLCTIKDFEIFCDENKINILKKILVNENGKLINSLTPGNFFASQGVYCVSKR